MKGLRGAVYRIVTSDHCFTSSIDAVTCTVPNRRELGDRVLSFVLPEMFNVISAIPVILSRFKIFDFLIQNMVPRVQVRQTLMRPQNLW